MTETRLLYLTDFLFPSRAASVLQVRSMEQAFLRQGLQVYLTGRRGRGISSRDSKRHYFLYWPFKRLSRRLMFLHLRWTLQRESSCIIYTRSASLAQLAIVENRETILELHGLPNESSQRSKALHKVLQHPKLRRIVTISRALSDDLVAEYGAPHQGCDIVVAHDSAASYPRPGPAVERNEPLRVGYFGHLYPGKGMETIAALAPMLPDLRFEIYGGNDTDILHWRAACAGQDNLTLHGHIPHEQVAARMTGCDILIAPYAAKVSHVGGGDIGRWMSPLKLFEYMAAERPVVAADLPVLREIVSHNKTALLCPPNDIVAYAAALRRLAASPALRACLGAAGRDLFEAKYTWENRARRVIDGIC